MAFHNIQSNNLRLSCKNYSLVSVVCAWRSQLMFGTAGGVDLMNHDQSTAGGGGVWSAAAGGPGFERWMNVLTHRSA